MAVAVTELLPFSHRRVLESVKRVKERLIRATGALNRVGLSYAVIGGNAVAVWVATVDESAVRNEPLVEILVKHQDGETAKRTLEAAGLSVGQERHEVHLVCEPNIGEVHLLEGRAILMLDALVTRCLERNRSLDQVHLRDMIEVGLIDESWAARYPAALGERLQALLDDPLG
jgi:hypothetical protein